MDRVTLIDKGVQFLAAYAAPSVLTWNFVACVPGADASEARAAFTHPGEIFVESVEGLYAPRTYTGYDLSELREQPDRIVVILSKEGEA